MIELINVNKNYNTKKGKITALKDINLTVNPGEICGVIGKSGAGKSTLIRCVNLLERPTSGSIKINHQELMKLSPKALRQARHRMGMIFQHFNLLSTRSVYQNIAFPLELIGASKKEIEKIIFPLLELTELSEKRDDYPSQLSGGQKQRVAIARALATKPNILLCDEMTSALDPKTTNSILELIENINHQMHLSILVITHEMDVIKKIADQVVVLEEGEIVEKNDVVGLYKNPKSTSAKNLIHSTLSTPNEKSLLTKLTTDPVIGGEMVIRIHFFGHVSVEPVMNDLIKKFDLRFNILQANFEYIRHDVFGVLVVALQANTSVIEEVLAYLNNKELKTEILGYVASDDQFIS